MGLLDRFKVKTISFEEGKDFLAKFEIDLAVLGLFGYKDNEYMKYFENLNATIYSEDEETRINVKGTYVACPMPQYSHSQKVWEKGIPTRKKFSLIKNFPISSD